MRRAAGTLLVFFFVFTRLFGQDKNVDSLKTVYRNNPSDIRTITKLFELIRKTQPDSASVMAENMIKRGSALKDSFLLAIGFSYRGQLCSDKGQTFQSTQEYRRGLGYLRGKNDSMGLSLQRNLYRNLGFSLSKEGKYKEAELILDSALAIAQLQNDTAAIVNTTVIYGQVLKDESKYTQALKILYYGLELAEASKDEAGAARLLNNIANVFVSQEKIRDALKFYNRSLEIKKRVGTKLEIANTYGNMGVCYYSLKDPATALLYYDSSLVLKRVVKDWRGIATTLHNTGLIYVDQEKYDSAEVRVNEALSIRKQIGDLAGVASSQNVLGQIYIETNRCREAVLILNECSKSSFQLGAFETYEKTLLHLAEAHACTGEYSKAYDYMQKYRVMHDTSMAQANRKLSEEMQSKYDSEQQEAEIQQLKKEKVLGDIQQLLQQDRDRQRTYFWIAAVVGFMLIVLFLVMRARENQKAKIKLEQAYTQIEEKNKSITDSIVYAKRIQESILPDLQNFQNAFADGFVFFKPKDIVSGDFWWLKQSNTSVFIAAADCTGHGVPGAFMSVMCSELLTQATEVMSNPQPEQLLNYTDKGIKRQLKQENSSESAKDGMDIGLVQYDRANNTLRFSGANRPLIHWRNGAVTVIKGHKTSLGGSETKELSGVQVSVEKGDMIYLFTDGYADQFGGPSKKKFKSSSLVKLLSETGGLSGAEQLNKIQTVFTEWQGMEEQVDDVCVIGFRC
jgi:serine phosphatase RsbU (regulator of sigma subunit)/tetratricopeptide (TPR) repeat protein